MKQFLVELMNQLLYFVAQSIDWYDVLSKSDESIFLSLQSIFFMKKTVFDLPFFVFFFVYKLIQLRYFWWNCFLNNFSLLSGL